MAMSWVFVVIWLTTSGMTMETSKAYPTSAACEEARQRAWDVAKLQTLEPGQGFVVGTCRAVKP